MSKEMYRALRDTSEVHFAVVLLLDTSSSMSPYLNLLEQAVDRFIDVVCNDSHAPSAVDVAIVTFDDKPTLIQDFTPVTDMQKGIVLHNGTLTDMSAGIDFAIDLINERRDLYDQLTIPKYTPWIFMLTDGLSTSEEINMNRSAQAIASLEGHISRKGKEKPLLKFISCYALGEQENEISPVVHLELSKLGPRIVVLNNYAFSDMLEWLAKSAVIISNSKVDEKVSLPNTPENTQIVPQRDPNAAGW